MAEYSPLRDYIVEEAKRHLMTVSDAPEMQVDGKRRGADKLRQILSEACERPPAWTQENLKALETPHQWINLNGRGGTTDSLQALHWCGIFATFVLRRVGLDLKWRSNVGIISPGPTKYLVQRNSWMPKTGFDRNRFATGDVLAIKRANHHFIVVDAPDGAQTLKCIAGNGTQQQIEWQQHSRSSIITHYELVWDPFASRL